MHPHIRTATAVALLALTVAACGSSAATASPSASPAASTPTGASLAPSASASAAPAASATASADASAGTASASPAATATPEPTGTPSPAEQALVDRLPTSVGGYELDHAVATLAESATSSLQNSFMEFALSLGIDPREVYIAYVFPSASAQPKAQWIYGAFQFTGADPKSLPAKYIEAALASQKNATATKTTFAGREVTKLETTGTTPKNPPIYVLFVGDTIFFGGSDDPALAEAIVGSFPR